MEPDDAAGSQPQWASLGEPGSGAAFDDSARSEPASAQLSRSGAEPQSSAGPVQRGSDPQHDRQQLPEQPATRPGHSRSRSGGVSTLAKEAQQSRRAAPSHPLLGSA